MANAAFSAGMVVFEIPTGVIADTLGRRVSFLLSVSVLGATTLMYVGLAQVEAGVVAFAAVSVGMGLGFTFYSGAMEAWLVDALAVTGYRGILDRVFARGQQITGTAMLVGTVGGGLLGQVDLALPYLVRSVLLAAVFVVAFVVMHDLGFTPRKVTAAELPARSRGTHEPALRSAGVSARSRLLMLASLVQGGFLIWAFYALQPYLLELLDSDAVWIAGLVAAGVAMSTIAGNQVVDFASRYCGRRTTLLLAAAAVESSAAVVLGLAASFWVALAALFLVTASVGVTSPVRSAYLHQIVPTEQRATVVSFDSMVTSVGGVGGQVGLGALGEARSVGAAFVAGGVVRPRRCRSWPGCAVWAEPPTGSSAGEPGPSVRAPPAGCRLYRRSKRPRSTRPSSPQLPPAPPDPCGLQDWRACPRLSSSVRSGVTRARGRSSTCWPRSRISCAAIRAARTRATPSSSRARRTGSARSRPGSSPGRGAPSARAASSIRRFSSPSSTSSKRAGTRRWGFSSSRGTRTHHAVARRVGRRERAQARSIADRHDAARNRTGLCGQGDEDRDPRPGSPRPQDPAAEARAGRCREERLARAGLPPSTGRGRGDRRSASRARRTACPTSRTRRSWWTGRYGPGDGSSSRVRRARFSISTTARIRSSPRRARSPRALP